MKVNFTMLAHSRPRLTRQTLNSLGNPELMNVTIMSHNASEEVNNVVSGWLTGEYDAHWFKNNEQIGTGEARNRVVEKSQEVFGRGDYLTLSDNDCFYHRGWLALLIAAYEVAWLSGYRIIGAGNHPFHRPVSTLRVNDGLVVNEVLALASQSMLMRWEVWSEFGPMCKTPAGKVCQSEDVDLSNRIRAAGYKVGVISPALMVNTGITNSFGEKIPGWEAVLKEAPEGIIVE